MCTSISAQPKVTTTFEKAVKDFKNGINNNGWYMHNGIYVCLFRNTPVSISHAFDKYHELVQEYKPDTCEVKDIISSFSLKDDSSLDYESLLISVKNESSEIDRWCYLVKGPIESIYFKSTGGTTAMWSIYLNPRKKK